jgi:hypothetical protein
MSVLFHLLEHLSTIDIRGFQALQERVIALHPEPVGEVP